MKQLSLILFILLACIQVFAGKNEINRVEPMFWWTGMKNPALQLMVHAPEIATTSVELNYPGVELKSTARQENPNYLFINLTIAPETKAGSFDLVFRRNQKEVYRTTYQLLEREPGSAERKGFDNSDVIYLITPDRFANGNPGNDNMPDMKETANRADFNGRHGGDIAGMQQHIGYLENMGFTAVWVNPVLENNMSRTSYHGYSTTDFYRVDPRFGTNEEYRQFSKELKAHGMKLIMDMIFNHIGSEHWWMNDLPSKDWLNAYPDIQITTHRRTVNEDPHASETDKRGMTDGWFVTSMPDLNQRNPFLATYLIQNSIWWTEYAGLSGIRMDTYPYPDKNMMAEWTQRMLEEYPHLGMVGEEWSLNPGIVAYWQKGQKNKDGYVSCLPSLMDFPVQNAVVSGLNEKENWDSGLIKIYEALANDFLYPDANKLVIFPDNHDMSRIYTQLHENDKLFRLATAFFLTSRGIPQIFYGTEILMANPTSPEHGIIRSDFPGGWAGDNINAFTGQGLSDKQKQTQDYFRKLLNWRKNQPVVHDGKLKHYVPQNGLYVYFRYNETGSVMVILNKNDEPRELETSRFAESLTGFQTGTDIVSGASLKDLSHIQVPAASAMIIELK
jgi:glycosidase